VPITRRRIFDPGSRVRGPSAAPRIGEVSESLRHFSGTFGQKNPPANVSSVSIFVGFGQGRKSALWQALCQTCPRCLRTITFQVRPNRASFVCVVAVPSAVCFAPSTHNAVKVVPGRPETDRSCSANGKRGGQRPPNAGSSPAHGRFQYRSIAIRGFSGYVTPPLLPNKGEKPELTARWRRAQENRGVEKSPAAVRPL